MNRIRLGLPKGSLNKKDRGNTQQVFLDAGYDIKGYEPDNEADKRLAIVNDPEIIAFLSRPQSAPVELSRELLDIAIIGEDWVREESISGKANIRRIGDLGYGQVRLVFAVRKDDPYESLSDFFLAQKERENPILCFTEYVNLARQGVMQNEGYQKLFGNKRPLVQIRGLVNGENELVQIINSDGVTEGYIAKGADIIVDNSQTGRTLTEYNLRELEKIMESSAGLYAGPSCIDWKEKKATEIFVQLEGAIIGKKYFDVKFNVPNEQVERVRAYLISDGLCSDEPTVSEGEKYTAVNILIPRERFPLTVKTLREAYSASAIVRDEVKQFIR
ncbi:MAG: ATP phosphoribosyltransferase [Candidatus Aenigmarchaeota archaeon]|nr:ATP phosphoribosyltransferase [Candidatus Aenigmarchaeota archaeon]